MIWTRPKQIGPVQNDWRVQNHFGPIEGQGIKVRWDIKNITLEFLGGGGCKVSFGYDFSAKNNCGGGRKGPFNYFQLCFLIAKTFWKIESANAIFWMYLGGTAKKKF